MCKCAAIVLLPHGAAMQVALHIKTRPFYSDAHFGDAVRAFARAEMNLSALA